VNPHFHTLAPDGVFTIAASGAVQFHPLPAPADEEVGRVLATVRRRIVRRLVRRGLGPGAEVTPPDPVAEAAPALAGLSAASVQGRVALGPRAGARVLALGRDPDAAWMASAGPRHAHVEGFDLHANVAVRGDDRQRLEQLCRYLFRPAVAQDRLRFAEDGRVVLELKSAWADGTSHLIFEPLDFLARLAALTPRPRINLVFYHGLLAPHARGRAGVVAYGRPPAVVLPPGLGGEGDGGPLVGGASSGPAEGHGWTWAQLMRRAFDLDVLACPRCGGRLRLIALLIDPRAIGALAASLGLASETADRAPPGEAVDSAAVA
jgi:hypothetical protein